MVPVPRLLPVAVLALLATACGSGTDGASRPPRSPTPTPAPSPASTPTPATRPSRLPSRPTDTFVTVRVVGTVVIGPAPGDGDGDGDGAICVDVLDDHQVRWTLLGPQAIDLEAGRRVEVVGRSRPETGPCTGAPLVVQRLRLLS